MRENNKITNLDVIKFIKSIYKKKFVPLHEPRFLGNEKKYLIECIDTTFVSTAGKFVDQFEDKIAKYTGAKYAIATSNGTSALHVALMLAGVDKDCEVLTQPITFVATCNAIAYCNSTPIFIDVEKDTMGLSPRALESFLKKNAIIKNQKCINKKTKKIIKACLPMHSYGQPCRIDKIREICNEYNIFLIEDAAESLGSFYKNKHTGTFGRVGIISFNGNKIITAGGGGCIITNDSNLAKKAKHVTTTAKVPHKWELNHNMVGYNYRMPNLNAALLLAQFEKINYFISNKRDLARKYEIFFNGTDYSFFKELKDSKSNYWLNSIVFKNKIKRDKFLEQTNSKGIMTRPIWRLMNKLPMFKDAQSYDLKNSNWLYERVVNIPSSAT